MRYYLKPVNEPEREVSREEYLKAAGDYHKVMPENMIPAMFIGGGYRGRLSSDDFDECVLRESINNSSDAVLPIIEKSLREDILAIDDPIVKARKTELVNKLMSERAHFHRRICVLCGKPRLLDYDPGKFNDGDNFCSEECYNKFMKVANPYLDGFIKTLTIEQTKLLNDIGLTNHGWLIWHMLIEQMEYYLAGGQKV